MNHLVHEDERHYVSEQLRQDRSDLFQSAIARYGFALVICWAALLLTHWAFPFINKEAFDFFQGAVFLSALYGGLGPAMLTACVSILALDYFFIPPINSLALGMADVLRLAIFGFVAVLTSSLSARLKRAKSDLERAYDGLEMRIQQRTDDLSHANNNLIKEMAQRAEAEKAILDISNREQQRLGQDLHDGLCQLLAAIKLMSEDLKEKLVAKSLPQSEEAALIESRLSEALAQADTISRGLYPVELEAHGLMSALDELTHKISNVYPVRCQFRCSRPVLVKDTTVATHLYRIAQEAVVNAIKGGKAENIRVRLVVRPSRIILTIADDGIGFHNKPLRQGMGLKIMNYRARMIHGELGIRSRPRGGTLVECSFPIQTIGVQDGN